MARSLRRDDRGVSTLWSFIGVVVLVAAILGLYYGYVVPKFAPPPLRAQSGHQVQFDYVGTCAENGREFDTNVEAIAKDTDTSSFVATYQTAAISGTNVTDPFWGWTATVSVAGTIVTVTNSPIPGQLVRPHGAWDAKVVSIDDAANAGEGAILVHHLLTPAMVDRVGQKNAGGTVVFVVTSVDTDAGTYTLNYNNPTKGRTLVFQVTMVSISRLY